MSDFDGTAHFQAKYAARSRNGKAKAVPRKAVVRSNSCAVFVHAGAGYHSQQNEDVHIQVVASACEVGMAAMEAGGTAVDAVELAIMMMEDHEITNAGYGSNLALDGIVECDACIVDQYGRSGAVGAIAQIKNPIQAARKVLEHSYTSLLLKRVPPILLVGQGATNFAANEGVPVLPYDALISDGARARWNAWQNDLRRAERKQLQRHSESDGEGPQTSSSEVEQRLTHPEKRRKREDPTQVETEDRIARKAHFAKLDAQRNQYARSSLSDTSAHIDFGSLPVDHPPGISASGLGPPRTEDQLKVSESPSRVDFNVPAFQPPVWGQVQHAATNLARSSPGSTGPGTSPSSCGYPTSTDCPSPFPSLPSASPPPDADSCRFPTRRVPLATEASTTSTPFTAEEAAYTQAPLPVTYGIRPAPDGALIPGLHVLDSSAIPMPTPKATISLADSIDWSYLNNSRDPTKPEEDHVTDTVGVIAIDSYGNVASGASSGGIGMKFRGRVGPAALIGIGCAVHPADNDDKDGTCVATVTSGTGEHIATSMAAALSADRLYHQIKKAKGGRLVDANEEEILSSFIEKEFMGHPGVKTGTSPGAIGVVGVKKTNDYIEFSYAHNTDSFVLGYQTSFDTRPECTMSRTRGNGQIACGGKVFPAWHLRRVIPTSD